MQARPVTGDEPGELVRYAVALLDGGTRCLAGRRVVGVRRWHHGGTGGSGVSSCALLERLQLAQPVSVTVINNIARRWALYEDPAASAAMLRRRPPLRSHS